jgi:hypothetical protein
MHVCRFKTPLPQYLRTGSGDVSKNSHVRYCVLSTCEDCILIDFIHLVCFVWNNSESSVNDAILLPAGTVLHATVNPDQPTV